LSLEQDSRLTPVRSRASAGPSPRPTSSARASAGPRGCSSTSSTSGQQGLPLPDQDLPAAGKAAGSVQRRRLASRKSRRRSHDSGLHKVRPPARYLAPGQILSQATAGNMRTIKPPGLSC